MRFANKMELGDKTHEVSMTAQRLVQRMMKDSIHSGRRPSGLCGAALLLAARMHEFCRTPMDIVRIVKIHESTLRKRLLEFGDTPSSMLTIDEFMAVDLEAEQDPPAFKAARKKDKERLQKLAENEGEFTELQIEIDYHLEKELNKKKRRKNPEEIIVHGDKINDNNTEDVDANTFIKQSTYDVINECLADDLDIVVPNDQPQGIGPDIAAMCLPTPIIESTNIQIDSDTTKIDAANNDKNINEELNLEDLDDEEINGYIMTQDEAQYKDVMWNKLNAEYLREAKEKEERLAKEKEEGKPEIKRRRTRRKNIGPSNTAGEAIEKMLQEKKISNKINYDILKTLTAPKHEIDDTSEIVTVNTTTVVSDESKSKTELDKKMESSFLFSRG